MLLKVKYGLGQIENIVGKGENAGYQHFLLFPHYFQNAYFSGSFKSGSCGNELISPIMCCCFCISVCIKETQC